VTATVLRPLIVVPAWNEEFTVGETVREIRAATPEIPVLVVSDGSTDDTVHMARHAGARVLVLPFRLGVGGAMRAGFRYAVSNGYDVAVQVDADGQHDPRQVPALLDELGEAEVVIGARFCERGDSYRVRGPRRWAMVVLSKVLSRLTKTRLTDATSGFKATGGQALPLFAEHYPDEYLGDTVESLVIAARAGCAVTQVPTRMRPRRGGEPSHRPLKTAIYLGRAALALVLALIRRWDVTPATVPAVGPAVPQVRPADGGLR
jgi:glycosyltransferase involved in cell wall biosynthesis